MQSPQQDDVSLANGNFSPLSGESDVLLEDIPHNMLSRLSPGGDNSAFTDDSERMYWERYMDPNHL